MSRFLLERLRRPMLTALRYFIEVVDRRSFTAAARHLNVAQPTLTRSLQNMEFRLNCKLVNRDGGAFELTPAGDMLMHRGRMLLAEYRSILSDLETVNRQSPEQVVVNGSLITSLHLIPQAMLRLAVEQPQIRVSLIGANDADYAWKRAAVLSGEVDAVVSVYDPANSEAGLVQELLVEPELKIMVRADHPVLRGEVNFEALLDYPWIVLPGRGNQATIDTEFRVRGLPLPRDTVAISEWRVALEMLRVTDLVTVVPYHPALLASRADHLVALPLTFHVRPLAIGMICRPLGGQRAPTRAFIDAVRKVVDDHRSQTSPIGI